MKLFNFTKSQWSIPLGAGLSVPPLTSTGSIVLNPGLIKSTVLVLINTHHEGVGIVLSPGEEVLLDEPGCAIPKSNLYTLEDATQVLDSFINGEPEEKSKKELEAEKKKANEAKKREAEEAKKFEEEARKAEEQRKADLKDIEKTSEINEKDVPPRTSPAKDTKEPDSPELLPITKVEKKK